MKNEGLVHKKEAMMGYFANSTEADLFYETYCVRCQNHEKFTGRFCVIWGLHCLFSYQLANSKSLAKKFLDLLIDKKGNDVKEWKCSMYKEIQEGCEEKEGDER